MSTLQVVNLTDAASMVIAATDVGGAVAETAVAVWCALLSLPSAEALAYAVDLHTLGSDTKAAIIPF